MADTCVTVEDVECRLGIDLSGETLHCQVAAAIENAFALVGQCLCAAVDPDECSPFVRARVIEMIARGIDLPEDVNEPVCRVPCPLKIRIWLTPQECRDLRRCEYGGITTHCIPLDRCGDCKCNPCQCEQLTLA